METKNTEEKIISDSSRLLLSSYLFGAYGTFSDSGKIDNQKASNIKMFFSDSGMNHAKTVASKAVGYELSEESFNAAFNIAIVEIVAAALKFGLFSYYIKEYPNNDNKDLSKYLQDVVDAFDFVPSIKTIPSRNDVVN